MISYLNNVIKIVYIIFLSGRAGLIRPTIGPSRARPNRSCRAWHGGPEVRPGQGPLSFVLGCACDRPAHLAQPGWPCICWAASSEVVRGGGLCIFH
jgi:hypothetical protein